MRTTVDVALIQLSCSDDITANMEKTVQQIRAAASRGAKIVCTQELFKSRYFPQVVDSALFNLAEVLDEANPTLKQLSQLAAELEIVLVASLWDVQNAIRQRRRLDLLGSVVPGGGAPDGHAGGRDHLYPNGHWLRLL
jgi:predicted amidohydrolase